MKMNCSHFLWNHLQRIPLHVYIWTFWRELLKPRFQDKTHESLLQMSCWHLLSNRIKSWLVISGSQNRAGSLWSQCHCCCRITIYIWLFQHHLDGPLWIGSTKNVHKKIVWIGNQVQLVIVEVHNIFLCHCKNVGEVSIFFNKKWLFQSNTHRNLFCQCFCHIFKVRRVLGRTDGDIQNEK